VVVNADEQGGTLSDYARVVWRRKWIVLVVAVALTALAVAYAHTKTPMYQASAQLIYESQLDVSDPSSGAFYIDPTQLSVQLNSVASEIASPDLAVNVKTLLGSGKAVSSYSVSAAPDATSDQTSSGSVGGNTVSITAVSPSGDTAARVANAYAQAFTAARKASQQASVRQAEQVIKSQLGSYTSTTARKSFDYVTLRQRLQDLEILEATVNGNFRVLVPATVPSAPFSPKPVHNGVEGLAAGLVVGIGFVLLLAQFDTRVRSREEAAALLGMPVMGHVRKMPAKALNKQPLFVFSDSHNPAAEAMRKLRGNLEFANIDGDVKSVFITSCLQGEGKSVTVCNLALLLAASGNRVVLVDGDLRRPQVHRYLNLSNAVGLSTVLTGRTDLDKALRWRSVGPGPASAGAIGTVDATAKRDDRLYVLTSGPAPHNPAEVVASTSFASLMAQLQAEFDLVIVDAPALLAVGDTAAIARCANGLIFLVDLTRAKRPLLAEAATQISHMPCRKLGLVVISAAPSRRYERHHYGYEASPLDSAVPGKGGKSVARS